MDILRQTFFLPYTFPSLNEYIAAMNQNRHIANKMKQEWTDTVAWEAKRQKLVPYTTPATFSFMWLEKNAKRDPDNIIFAKKFILDGLVMAGIIPNDTQKWVRGFNAERWMVVKDPRRVGVEVAIREASSAFNLGGIGDETPDREAGRTSPHP